MTLGLLGFGRIFFGDLVDVVDRLTDAVGSSIVDSVSFRPPTHTAKIDPVR